ncbi:hypothetical protein EDD18DRAFT_1359204 [Armillaria luteobubalina]|uniref:DUF6818 domain-containing protein n=1 Tax=Armillaria luteobubalina TaxID=153913 RepID=A0AA39PVD5_9AGAR|nr:hypothetical protein EDD18DRAFT_1359204 [Armillaria luteobubalina]
MSELSDNCSHHQLAYTHDEFGAEYAKYSPDGPWVMLGQYNSSNAQVHAYYAIGIYLMAFLQLPGLTGGSQNGSELPSFQDTFSDSLPMLARTLHMSLPPALRAKDANRAWAFNSHEQTQSPLTSSLEGNVDPVHVPLLDGEADDFPSASRLLPTVAHPAIKVAGTQHSDPKGKRWADILLPVALSKLIKKHKANDPELLGSQAKKKKGKREGAGNYCSNDLDMLCDVLEMWLPLGGKAWNSVTDEFNAWAHENGHPTRAAKSLEAKFKQLVKTSKLTGDAECPPHVERAHEIEDLMNDKAGSRDLDDNEIIDVDNVHESSDEENIPVKKSTILVQPPIQGPIACHSATDYLTNSVNTGPHQCNNAQDILQNISSVLSPDAQLACSEEFLTRSMQTTQIFTLTALNRDLQNRIDQLQSDLATAKWAHNEAEHRADRSEMMCMLHESSCGHHTPSQHDNRVYQEVRYSDDGRALQCVDLDSPSAYDLLSGDMDSPNTHRYTLHPAH